ncbi:hypothetical protein DIPPA_23756 [Diplonema papillatum]|nr:hypothetical protein DIPPA_23756 [Diplonema papillatum]
MLRVPMRSAQSAVGACQRRHYPSRPRATGNNATGMGGNLSKPTGQMGRMGRAGGQPALQSLGCVLKRKTLQWSDGVLPALKSAKGIFYVWWSLQDIRRRRDDLHRPALEQLYKTYRIALAEMDLEKLKAVLSAYEFDYTRKDIKAEKAKMSLKQLTNKVTATCDITTCYLLHAERLDFPHSEYLQVNAYFEGSLHVASALGDETVPIKEYCVFELAHSTDADNVVAAPLKICGRYDTRGDRIGKDAVDPHFYAAAQQATENR